MVNEGKYYKQFGPSFHINIISFISNILR